ncbi:gag protein [Lasius niger]|uniref:Gag protein n=1 Tax=Lasius niger TaxID=67767 RepID=A0A0J7N5E0_LASNI|nr:gag protein [Lasius niger]
MQIEFERRENELLRRKLEIARRENEQLRRVTPSTAEETHRKENISAMLELVGFFDESAGTFRKWEQQVRHDTKSADSPKDREKKEEKLTKNEEGKSKSPRCYNCNKIRHLAADCRQPKREKGSCFKCGEMGHISKDCPAKATSSTQVAVVNEAEEQICSVSGCTDEEETFFRDIDYAISRSDNNQNFKLNTLMDTVVPDTTMISPIVLGRDVLKEFGLGLRKLEAQAIDDIFNVEVSGIRDTISDSLIVNTEVSREVQSSKL